MQTLIQRIADKHLYRVNSNLLEDYSTNPIAPNDTSYVGFFFEKDVTQFPPKLREKYEAMKAEIDLKEAEYREKYGDDWRNIAVFNAYRGIKEEVEAVSEAKEIGNEMDDLSTEELRGLFKDWGGLKISYSRYYKTDNKGYYWYLVVRNYSGSNNFFPAILTFKPKPLGAGYFKDEMSLSGAKTEGYTKLESAKQIAANWGTGKKYDLMAESGNAESINETGMTKDVALHYAKITSLKVGNMMLFSHPELGYYTNPESDSEGAASLKKRGAKHVATASGGKLNFKMESLSEDHFSEKELTNMYSKFDKENNHDGLEAIEDYISAEADGNKAAAAKAAGKLKKLMKEDVISEGAEYTPTFKKYGFKKGGTVSGGAVVFTHPLHGSVMVNKFGEWHHVPHGSSKDDGFEGTTAVSLENHLNRLKESVSEAIKGWKNAHSDIAKARSEQGKNVVLHRLKNDGTESGMATARTSFSSEEEALRRHEDMVKLNPGKKIGHNLYVDGKFIKALGESVSDSTVKMSMPLFIRLMEWAFEECKDDVQIHKLAENLSEISSVADMEDYPKLVKEDLTESESVVFSKKGKDGREYRIIEIGSGYSVQDKDLKGNWRTIDTYPSLQRAKGVLANEVAEEDLTEAQQHYMGKWRKGEEQFTLWNTGNYEYSLTTAAQVDGEFKKIADLALNGKSIEKVKEVLSKNGYKPIKQKGIKEAYGDAKYGLGKKSPEQVAQKKARWERHVAEVKALRDQINKAEESGNHEQADRLEEKLKILRAMGVNLQAYDK